MASQKNLGKSGEDDNRPAGYRRSVQFLRRGRIEEISGFPPTAMVLDYLRESRRDKGTKEGCAEGDCGACTVVVGTPQDGRIEYRAVNSCIQPLGTLDGKHLITVDDLALDGELHPVQSALVRHHGSQCGFCTPGFVMALFALGHRRDRAPLTRQQVCDALAGNLCRCTGYRPIVDAALEACESLDDAFKRRETENLVSLEGISSSDHIRDGDSDCFFSAPADEDELAALYQRYPDATLVAGATDVALWITKDLRDIARIIYLGRVKGLNECRTVSGGLEIGAACTYADAHDALTGLDPDIGELVRRIGSEQIRNAGTIGGNIANGSPIGDMPPVLIALDSSIELRSGETVRRLPLQDFFIDYGKQDRKAGEYLRMVHVPEPGENSVFRCYKVAKRFDQDITATLGAFLFHLSGRKIESARIAYGGMAAIPKRAAACEGALAGVSLDDPAAWRRALEALGTDFEPLSDHRASAGYRLRVARALLEKALIEIADPASPTRLVGEREMVDA